MPLLWPIPSVRRPHAVLSRRVRRWRRTMRARRAERGDPAVVSAGAAGERFLARVRLWLFAALLAVPLVQLPAGGLEPWEQRAVIGYPLGALAIAGLLYLGARRGRLPGWFGLASGVTDVSLVTAALAGFFAFGQPIAAVNSTITFELYFLGVAATALRYDWRVCALAGGAAVSQYLALAAWATAHYDLRDAQVLAAGYGVFRWGTVGGRCVLLALAAALAAALVRRAGHLRMQSVRDRLTGLANRAYFDERLAEAFELRARRGTPVAVVLLDVDHFKQVNDRHGHGAGDAVLRAVARALRRQARGSDVLARYGGEEFALLLADGSGAAAVTRAEALRTAVGAVRVVLPGGVTVAVTASAGVASSEQVTERNDADTAAAVVGMADERLYQAKRAGRNRVVADSDAARATPTVAQKVSRSPVPNAG